MRRHHLLLVLGVCALLLTPSAGGGPMVPGDPTPPVVTPHFFGTLGLNGWWVSNVTLNWTVEDPESQILETRGCDAVTLTNGHGRHLVHLLREERRRRDDGHGHDPASTRRRPWSPPRPSRSPDSNGWYNHALSVGFSGTDATSGMDSCVPPQSYSGPDNANASVSGSCRDRAGNVTVQEFRAQLRRDRAPGDRGERLARPRPRRLVQPHADDRLRRAPTSTSGIDTCTQTTLLGARSTQRLGQRHLPRPGGEHERRAQLQLPVRRDRAGGNRHALAEPRLERLVQPCAVGQLQRDRPTSGIDTCVPRRRTTRARTTRTPRSPAPAPTTPGTARSAAFGLQLRRDGAAGDRRRPRRGARIRTAGTTTRSRSRSRARDATSGIDTCTQTTYSGPDDATGTVNGTCRDRAGQHEREQRVQLPVRRHGPRRHGHSVARSRLERLVQPRADGRLHRHRRDFGHGFLRPGRRATRGRTRRTLRSAALAPTGPGTSTVAVVRAQLRRDRADGDRCEPLALARSRRLVQPRALDRLRGRGCDLGDRLVHAGDATRAPIRRNASVSGTCRDRAGNTSASSRFGFQYDETDPVVTATPSRNPDSNGWYNHALSVSFSGTDATSGIDSCVPPQALLRPRLGERLGLRLLPSITPGTPSVARVRAQLRRDRAGGHRDSLTQSRLERLVQPRADGQLQRHGRDVGPGLLRPGRRRYSGPDDAERLRHRFLHRRRREHDRARSSGSSYDATGPVGDREPRPRSRTRTAGTTTRSRSPSPGRMPTSGVDTCVPPQTYAGPDDAERVGQRLLRGSRGEHDHARFRAELRRDRPGGHARRRSARRTRTAGTTMRSRSASPAPMRPRASTPACRRRRTPAPTTANAVASRLLS